MAYIPWPVVEGFTVGIAVIIFLQQVPGALGVAKPAGENTAVVAVRALHVATGSWHGQALLLVALVAVVMVALPRVHRSLPSSLIAVIVATVVASAAGWDVARIGTLPHGLPTPTLPDLGQTPHLLSAALAVAVLAAIESLLSAKVADGMADVSSSDPDRELFGQGLANLASAAFGGMPATGAIARTAVNARAGARTRLAAVVHSITLLVVVLFAGSLVARIPLAALGGRPHGHGCSHGRRAQRTGRAAVDPVGRRGAGPHRHRDGGLRPHRGHRDRHRRGGRPGTAPPRPQHHVHR